MFGFGPPKRKPRQFEYRPRFYDPQKEAWEERRRELFGEREDVENPEKEYVPGQYIRRDMLTRRGVAGHGKRSKRLSVPVAIFVIALLLLIGYWALT